MGDVVKLKSISIIIPIYNVAEYVVACLNSVIAQTYEGPIECILVDDCGKDNSMAIVKDYVESYNGKILFKILHHERNRGLSAARNTAMEVASGDYIFFLDSDDEITPDCIDVLAEPLREYEYDMVIGGIKTIGDDELKEMLELKMDECVLHQHMIFKTYSQHLWNVMAQVKLYRKKFIKEEGISFKEGLIHEDELWTFQLACIMKSLKIVKKEVYLYYVRKNGIMASGTQDRRMSMLKTIAYEMGMFLKQRKLLTREMYVCLQSYVYWVLKYYAKDYNEFCSCYAYLVEASKRPWLQRLKYNNNNLKYQIRDIHYFFPESIAKFWEYCFIKLTR